MTKGKKGKPTNRFIQSIRLRNILSFGPDNEEIELLPLNVLIGPNASGKSNFIEAISLLKAAPVNLMAGFRERGGLGDWVWKGAQGTSIEIEVTVGYANACDSLRYGLKLSFSYADSFDLWHESIEREHPETGENQVGSFYRRSGDSAILKPMTGELGEPGSAVERKEKTFYDDKDYDSQQPILSQSLDPDLYPEIHYLGRQFRRIRLFRDWVMGPRSHLRWAQDSDMRDDFLLEDATNLSVVIDHLRDDSELRAMFRGHLHSFADQINDVVIETTDKGKKQICLKEEGERLIRAQRLSDGTLRYLGLLTILCHPEPPPLICIEEPELGLHPDMIGSVAELLVEASKRTQLIVTTHSEILVSALSDTPESILVCEQDVGGTKMRRLERDRLKDWLKDYSLGDIWAMGEIGGGRW